MFEKLRSSLAGTTFKCPNCDKEFSSSKLPPSMTFLTVVCDSCGTEMDVSKNKVSGWRWANTSARTSMKGT